MITAVVRNIFRINLGIKKTERCLIFSDTPSPAENIGFSDCEKRSRLKCIALLAAEIGHQYAKEIIILDYPATGTHGAEPPAGLWEAAFGSRAVSELKEKRILNPILKKNASEKDIDHARKIIRKFSNDAVNAVIALSNYSASHTRFRHFLTEICLSRYASMPLFEMSMLEGPMNVDWKQLARITREIAGRMNEAEGVEITSPNGTRISFSIKGRKALADTGILNKPGSFGNLPAGEAFLAPVEGTANGKLVLEWAPTRELRSPLTLVIKNGLVREIEGEEPYAAILREKFADREDNRNIAELGIGTNSRANRPDNILESEKIIGTIHIALGDNSSFGGKVSTPFHQDFVFFKPTVVLLHKDRARVVLMKRGKFV